VLSQVNSQNNGGRKENQFSEIFFSLLSIAGFGYSFSVGALCILCNRIGALLKHMYVLFCLAFSQKKLAVEFKMSSIFTKEERS
jgi:hypothetical protein